MKDEEAEEEPEEEPEPEPDEKERSWRGDGPNVGSFIALMRAGGKGQSCRGRWWGREITAALIRARLGD